MFILIELKIIRLQLILSYNLLTLFKIRRGWYTDRHLPEDMNQYPAQIKAMIKSQLGEMDKVVFENCAITCRVAPSFLRIGHIELHARRARGRTPLSGYTRGEGEPTESIHIIFLQKIHLSCLFSIIILLNLMC